MLKKTFKEFREDKALMLSASLAYYCIISIIPFFVLLFLIAGIIFEPTGLIQIMLSLASQIGGERAYLIMDLILGSAFSRSNTAISLISLVVLFIGATALFIHIQDVLNMIWNVPEKKMPTKKKIRFFFKKRIVSFFLIFVLVFLLIVFIISSFIISSLSYNLNPGLEPIFNVINYGSIFFIITLFFGLIYKFLPDRKISNKAILKGSLFTSFLFIIGQILLGVFFNYVDIGGAFGVAGVLIAILVWIYYTSAIFLFGAEFTYLLNRA